MMRKSEKELNELRKLVNECVEEQKRIGLNPVDGIEIYFGVDPVSKHKPNSTSDAISIFRTNGTAAIVVKKKMYDIFDAKKRKELIHHELIHLNLINGQPIRHKYNWKEFSDCCKKVLDAYGIDPSVAYSQTCFDDNGKFRYNRYTVCPKCNRKTFNFLPKESEFYYSWNITCCGNCDEEIEVLRK